MEERIEKLEQRVLFLESSLIQTLHSVERLQGIVEVQTDFITKLAEAVSDNRTVIKALSGIKV